MLKLFKCLLVKVIPTENVIAYRKSQYSGEPIYSTYKL